LRTEEYFVERTAKGNNKSLQVRSRVVALTRALRRFNTLHQSI